MVTPGTLGDHWELGYLEVGMFLASSACSCTACSLR